MSCRIVIPSHKRADRVLTTKLVKDPILCVAESQLEEYKKFNQDVEIVTHPDTVVGLIPKRNWMAKHFGELFMLDDDLYSFRRTNITKGEQCEIHDKQLTWQIIQNLYNMAKMMNVSLFGFANIVRPLEFHEFEPLNLRKSVTGRCYGVIYNENIWWNEEMKLKEDYWISCYVKYKERKVLTDSRYTFLQKDTMVNAGGLAQIRNHTEETRAMVTLKQYFGDVVHVRAIDPSKNVMNSANISVSFPC